MTHRFIPQARLRAEILRLLAERAPGKTICPSEAARAAAGSDDPQAWKPLMDAARRAALSLVADGEIAILQRGCVVDGATAKGPIRLRLR